MYPVVSDIIENGKMRRVLLAKAITSFTGLTETTSAVGKWRPPLLFQHSRLLLPSKASTRPLSVSMSREATESCGAGEESRDAGGSSEQNEGGSASADPFSYFQRGFTSEVFKIEVGNIPQHVGYQVCALHHDDVITLLFTCSN